MPWLWIRRLCGLSLAVLAALALIFSLHTGGCDSHDHHDDGKNGGELTHLVCNCTCHAVIVPDDLTPSIPTVPPSRPFAGTTEQDAIVGVVLEVDPPTDKRSA